MSIHLNPQTQAVQPRQMLSVNKTISKEDKIKAAHDYEEMFFKFFLKEIMPKDIEGGLFGTGHSAEMYQSMLIDAFAKSAAKRGVGIAEHVIKAINRNYPEQNVYNGARHDQYA
jgi:flagellar protein FlgJ